jgi:hypothetical protein
MLAKVSWGLGARSRNNRDANLTIGTNLQTLVKVSVELPSRSWNRLLNNREANLTIGTNLQTLAKLSVRLHDGRMWNQLWNKREAHLMIGTNLQTLVKVSIELPPPHFLQITSTQSTSNREELLWAIHV